MERSVAMKAPVGLLSGRAVCVSRWRCFAPTSSAERSKRIFTGGVATENCIYDPSRENGIAERPQTLRYPEIKIILPLMMRSNDDDRRQRRKQGGVVGAAASKTRVPPKARCGCWVPQPGSKRKPFSTVLQQKGCCTAVCAAAYNSFAYSAE